MPRAEGSPEGEEYLVVARVVRPRGNRGEVLAEIETDFPGERLCPGPVLLRDADGRILEMEAESTWFHKERLVLKLAGVDSITEAERLRGLEWVIPEEEATRLPEGTYYRHRLVGLEVRDPAGNPLGRIRRVEPGRGTDLLVLVRKGREVLVPAARQFVLEINEEKGYAVFDLPEGLVELNP